MTALLNYYNYLIEECGDPRTKDWLFVHSPVPIVVTLCSYYYFVRVGGPKWMKNRNAYSFKTYMRCYNIFQILSNAAVVYGTVTAGWLTTYSFGCVHMNPSRTDEGYRMAVCVWWTLILKLIDLTETMVFVLRKKTNQISFLHVYHHITTALITWMFAKWMPGGMQSMIILINCGVHVIMYSYYLLSTGGPNSQLLAGIIKPWITIIQLTQFCILFVHTMQGLLPSCKVPKISFIIVAADLMMNFYLFVDFYHKSYVQKRQKPSKTTE